MAQTESPKLTMKTMMERFGNGEDITLDSKEMREWANTLCIDGHSLLAKYIGDRDFAQQKQDIEDICSGKIQTYFRGREVKSMNQV